jgi:pimeloyl-ACP methyl ester carboxylesterase
MKDAAPLILFSGMGADERVFRPQMLAFPEIVVPAWITPDADESLACYAARVAKRVDPGSPCFIGGASFGGMVAIEAARHLRHGLGCFLIGSVRSPRELPVRLRALRPAVRYSHRVPFGWLPPAARGMLPLVERFSSASTCGMARQAADSDPAFLRWACGAVLKWEAPVTEPTFPIHQIHGDRDPILPWRLTRPDVLVRGGGHVLTLSHPAEVNEFIRSRIRGR